MVQKVLAPPHRSIRGAARSGHPSNGKTIRPADTVADFFVRLGGIAPERVRMIPPPGTATAKDLERNRGCELIEGTLVEKALGNWESFAGMYLAVLLFHHVEEHDLGIYTGPDGGYRFRKGSVRFPDLSFIAKSSLPEGLVPVGKVWKIAPDLVVEVLSRGNTIREMELKRKAYFKAGVKEAWMVDPKERTIAVYKSEKDFRILKEPAVLSGGTLIPGFRLSLKSFFSRVAREKPSRPK